MEGTIIKVEEVDPRKVTALEETFRLIAAYFGRDISDQRQLTVYRLEGAYIITLSIHPEVSTLTIDGKGCKIIMGREKKLGEDGFTRTDKWQISMRLLVRQEKLDVWKPFIAHVITHAINP